METQEASPRRSGSESMPATLSRSISITDDQIAEYERYVKHGKEAAKLGNLTKSIELFNLANEIHSSEKLRSRIKKLEEALKVVALDEDADDDFVDVLNSGLMLYKDLYNKLFPHQREGIAFLYELYRANKKGGLLADDMGLGKTIQIIAFLSGMFDAELIKYVLLVMPTTLISIWEKEFVKWTPGMRVSEFHGTSKNERTRNLEKVQRKGGIVITTYQMLINNWEQISSYNGQEFMWDYMILDEAHKIKTSSTKTSKCAHKIPSKNRILLTGTPVQNNLREMWSLFDFACKGRLLGTSKTFKMEYENPITRAREKDSTPGEKALGLKISENLMNIIKPYFLRRTKEDIEKNRTAEHKQNHIATTENNHKGNGPEMPTLSRKNDLIVWVYLGEVQEEIYRKFLSLDQIKELLMTTRSPLAELNILKKLCDHPRLLSGRACSQLGLEGQDDEQYNDVEHTGHTGPTKIDHLSDECLIQESGKLVFLMGLLERLQEEGHRTLVFSQSRKMLDIIDRVLKNRGFKIMRIDGTVTHIAERERRITLFQTNKTYSVFLLTTQVGGVGITLTAADRVVIFDPSWNPATDAQAVDRAYRIGQTENVVIYRLITCGTVEEKIYRRQVFKDSLIRQTTGDKKNPFRYFSKQELKELFSLADARTSTTQIQLQSLHSAQRKTDAGLDDHIAYLHSLDIFGISDHDLMYSHEVSAHEEPDGDEEECNYIQHRVQKAQELVMLESDMHGQIESGTEEAWIKQPAGGFATKTKRKPAAEPNNRKPDIPLPNTVDLTLDEEDVVNMSCHMTSLVIEDSDEEMLEESVLKSDVYIAEESQISEKQGNDPNSNGGVPNAPSLLTNDCYTFETSAAFLSDKDHSSTSQTSVLNGQSFKSSKLCLDTDVGGKSNDDTAEQNQENSALFEYVQTIAKEHNPMDTSLLLERPALAHTSNVFGSDAVVDQDKVSKSISNTRLSGCMFTFPEAKSKTLYEEIDSVLSSSQYSRGSMFKSPGELKPSRDATFEGDLLASQSPFQCEFNLLLEDSVVNESGSKENSPKYYEKKHGLNRLAESSLAASANTSFVEENRSNDHKILKPHPIDCDLKLESGEDSDTKDVLVSNTKNVARMVSGSEENGCVPSFMDIETDKGKVQIIDSDSEEERPSLAVFGNVNEKKRRVQRIDSDSEEEHTDLAVIDNAIDKKRRVQRIESYSEEEKGLVSSFVDKVTKRRVNRIDSDSEDDNVDIPAINNATNEKQKFKIIDSDQENDSICALIGDGDKVISPFNSPLHSTLKGINASTPKQERSILELLFPPKRSMGFNTSTASRRSLVRAALDDLDDLDETVPGNEEQEEMEEMDGMAEEEECNEETKPKLGPVGEVGPLLKGNSSYLDGESDMNNSSMQDVVEDTADELTEDFTPDESTKNYTQDESTEETQDESTEETQDESIEEGTAEQSTGDGELVSGENIDCFTAEQGVSHKDVPATNLKNKLATVEGNSTSSYETLVQLGKDLKENGKFKESLNCLLKALDIQSGDPEVMLLTLSLYKQLSQC